MLVKETIQFSLGHSLKPGFGGYSMTKRRLKKLTSCGPNSERTPSWIPSLASMRTKRVDSEHMEEQVHRVHQPCRLQENLNRRN
jgi:hypothetical protein